MNKWKYGYETTYGKKKDYLEQPVIIAVSTRVDLHPNEKRYHVTGSYQFRNMTGNPIRKVWLGVHPEVTSISWELPGTKPVLADELFRQYMFSLNKPLEPGGTTSIQFSMEVDRGSFKPFNSEHSVVENGTYIELEKYIPFLELQSRTGDRRSGSAGGRRNYHLSKPLRVQTAIIVLSIMKPSYLPTLNNQRVVTVGKLQGIGSPATRHYFHYRSGRKIPFMFALSCCALCHQGGEPEWNKVFNFLSSRPGAEPACDDAGNERCSGLRQGTFL